MTPDIVDANLMEFYARLTAADLDSDGDMDVVWARQQPSSTFIRENINNTSFGAGPTLEYRFRYIVDYDSDGDLDLFTTPMDNPFANGIAENRVVQGGGDFAFFDPVGAPVGAPGDLDGDGDIDAARITGTELAPTVTVSRNVCIENPVILAAPNNTVADAGQSIVLGATVAGADTFQWIRNGQPIFDDGRVTGTDTDTLTIDPAQPGDTDLYAITATNTNGTSTSAPAILAIRGEAGPSCLGDANGDGVIDLADLNAVLAAFGQACP